MTAVPLTVGLILVRKAMKAVKAMMDVVPFPVTRQWVRGSSREGKWASRVPHITFMAGIFIFIFHICIFAIWHKSLPLWLIRPLCSDTPHLLFTHYMGDRALYVRVVRTLFSSWENYTFQLLLKTKKACEPCYQHFHPGTLPNYQPMFNAFAM